MHDAINERPYINKLHIMEIIRGIREYNQRPCFQKYRANEIIQDVSIFRTHPQLFSLTLPSRKRSLYPKSSLNLPGKSRIQSCSLLLTVVGGRNVPINKEGTYLVDESNGQDVMQTKNDDLVIASREKGEPCTGVLVKIRFRGKCYQTRHANCGSSSPQWNETFCIPLYENQEELFLSTLLDEVIHLAVFDCATVDLKHMGGFYEDEDSRHPEVRYLVRAPPSSLDAL